MPSTKQNFNDKTKEKAFRTHNPYSPNNPIIIYYSTLSLEEQKLYREEQRKKQKEIALLKKKEQEEKELKLREEKLEKLKKEFVKLFQEENEQRKKIITSTDIRSNKLHQEITNNTKKLITETQKKEKAKAALIRKQVHQKLQALFEQEEKALNNISKEMEKSYEYLCNAFLEILLLNIKERLENFNKNNKTNNQPPELTININIISDVFKKLIKNIKKHENITDLTFLDIHLLQKVNWYIDNFGKKIKEISKQNNISIINDINFKMLGLELNKLIDKILTTKNFNQKLKKDIIHQMNAFSWLEQAYDLRHILEEVSSEKKSFDSTILNLEDLHKQQSKKEIRDLNKSITEIILEFQSSINKVVQDNKSKNNIVCEEFWEQFFHVGLDLAYVHHSAPKNSLIALLIETCQSKTPFTFNIYLKKALEFEINLNENIDNSKCNIFYLACQNGQHEMVASLLLHNVDINILSGQQVTAFDIACIQGHEKVVRLFLNKDVNINRYVRGCMPIIFKVIYEDKLAVFEELLSFPGINLNKFDIKNADTPLTYAIFQRKTKMAKLLIAHGADVNLKNEKGANAFHRACYYGETEIMEELLKINPEFINMPDDKGTTPAWICSEIDNTKVTEILIKNGADFKRIIHNNMSPATNAIKKGNNTTLMMALNQAPEQPANTEESMPEATASFKI